MLGCGFAKANKAGVTNRTQRSPLGDAIYSNSPPLRGCLSKYLREVMWTPEYKYDKKTQEKVQEYFKRRYPGHRKYDETGKPIRD